MGPAQSLHDALDSQQRAQRDTQAGSNAGGSERQQGARAECRTRTRSAADSHQICTEGGSAAAQSHLQTGDLIFFVSTRKNLDTFHAGIIVRDGKKVSMRHASRSQASVVEQELSEFLKANRMAGVIVCARKRCRDDPS